MENREAIGQLLDYGRDILTLKKRRRRLEVKNKVGRPLKFTPESLQMIIDTYFETTLIGEYTITGLALLVGSKQLIQDYEKRKDFSEIIKRAKLMVENDYELSLRKHGKAGDIFGLKNFGWKDQQDLKVDSVVKHGISDDLAALIEDIVGSVRNDP